MSNAVSMTHNFTTRGYSVASLSGSPAFHAVWPRTFVSGSYAIARPALDGAGVPAEPPAATLKGKPSPPEATVAARLIPDCALVERSKYFFLVRDLDLFARNFKSYGSRVTILGTRKTRSLLRERED